MAWLTGWKYRKKITVQDANVIADLTDFPAYIFINADADFHQARADGHDIRFTLSDGTTLLEYEREHWTGGNGSPATAHFWVKVPSILASGGATIYIYYGKSDAPDGQDAPNVWDANFKGVWHMKDITPTMVADSIGVNDGTKKAANEPIEADGKIYKGQDFDGEDDYVDCGSFDVAGAFSMVAWIKPDVVTGLRGIIGNLYHYAPCYGACMYQSGTSVVIAAGDGAGNRPAHTWANILTAGVWTFLVVVYDGSKFLLYVDGVKQDYEWTATVAQNSTKWIIGQWSSAYLAHYVFDGLIDEVRVSNVARTLAWHKFEHYNINEADNEITWGAEDAVPAKFSSSMRANSARMRETRSAFVKTTRPSIGTITRKGYIK